MIDGTAHPTGTAGLPAQDEVHPRSTAARGVPLLPDGFERVVTALNDAIDALLDPAESLVRLQAPPVISLDSVAAAGYVAAFPHLLGTVHTYQDDPARWRTVSEDTAPGGRWYTRQAPTDVVLLPAACYHVYPTLAGGRVEVPVAYSVTGYCFREETSEEPGRLRTFRMREFVRIGDADCERWRDEWRARVANWLAVLGLDVSERVANDPFYGPRGRLLRAEQRELALKWELVATVAPGVRQAVASCNYHKQHFGSAFAILGADGEPAHSACIGFGLERLALALIHAHGPGAYARVRDGRG